MTLAKITVFEMKCAADDYDTESGRGFADDVEPYEVEVYELDSDDLDESGTVEDAIQRRLGAYGLGQWEGGTTAYDPDGTHMAQDGTITERFARVEIF